MTSGHVYMSAVFFATDNINCISYPMENIANDHFCNVFMEKKQ